MAAIENPLGGPGVDARVRVGHALTPGHDGHRSWPRRNGAPAHGGVMMGP